MSQQIDSGLLTKMWDASWIAVPETALKDYGVYKFRKSFDVPSQPSTFIVHVSADNRYKLFVNGTLVSLGPMRGDFYHWNFETVDIAKQLKAGTNTIAALVWNEGDLAPEAQVTEMTAFILQGNSDAEKVVNTNESWKCIQDKSYKPMAVHVKGYYAAGAGEFVNMNSNVKGWENGGFNDNNWKNAQKLSPGNPKGVFSFNYGWMLQPSPLPKLELTKQRILQLRKAEGVKIPASFPATDAPVTIPAHTKTTILLDQTFLTDAYPTLVFSKGKNAGISISYAEGLYIKGDDKGNRNEVEGKTFIGKKDSIISDGSNKQNFTPLWWRTYRYVQLKIDTKDEPLVINDLYGTYTGYPFTLNASFTGGPSQLQKVLDIGWRTARLCAVETYMDCPYYEQLQYIGDTRIQALVSYYNSGDDRLVRNAINLMDASRIPEGITLSRYPSRTPQQIPFFSCWYIGMLHDYWMYRNDSEFVKSKLPGERQVLDFFSRYQEVDGSLKDVPYWTFTDWVEGYGWKNGIPPIDKNGESSLFDLQLLLAFEIAAEMEDKLGMKEFAEKYNAAAAKLKTTVQQKYWDEKRRLYADTPDKNLFSQHANALAILTGVVTGNDATTLAKAILTDTSLAPASIYFKYYLHQAAIKAGLGNDYLQWLGKWYENIDLGLTTWAEMSDVRSSRSDCHAWGSSPNIELYRTILGIDSDAPGFSKVRIEPHLGTLENAGGEMPHPNGKISVDYKKSGGKWNMQINLPANVDGSFIWEGKTHSLHSGKNELKL